MNAPRAVLPRSTRRLLLIGRRVVQAVAAVGFLALALRYNLVPGAKSAEVVCPFGGIETTWMSITQGTFLRNLAPTNLLVLLAVLFSALLLGRAFCGWACVLGAIQDGLAGLMRWLGGKGAGFPLQVPHTLDRILRWGKVLVLGWVVWASLSAIVPPLAPFCPLRTLVEFNASALLSWGVILMFASLSMLIERFWCRYLCPLGAVLSVFNRISWLRPVVNVQRCVECGRCDKLCPAGINPVQDGTDHLECVRCYACMASCQREGALVLGRSR